MGTSPLQGNKKRSLVKLFLVEERGPAKLFTYIGRWQVQQSIYSPCSWENAIWDKNFKRELERRTKVLFRGFPTF